MPFKHQYSIGNTKVLMFGHQPRIKDCLEVSFRQAVEAGASRKKISQLIVASDRTSINHKQIMDPNYDDLSYGDGILLPEPGSAGVIQTADCAAVIFYNSLTGLSIIAHAGRSALSGTEHCSTCTVIANAMKRIVNSSEDASAIEVLVIGNICGLCFKHDHESAKHLLEPFKKMPYQIFADKQTGSLDLYEVIKHLLIYEGVPLKNIRHEGPCTFEEHSLASYRRDKDNLRNTIIAVRP